MERVGAFRRTAGRAERSLALSDACAWLATAIRRAHRRSGRSTARIRSDALRCYGQAMTRHNLERALRHAMAAMNPTALVAAGPPPGDLRPTSAIAIGKAAPGMT